MKSRFPNSLGVWLMSSWLCVTLPAHAADRQATESPKGPSAPDAAAGPARMPELSAVASRITEQTNRFRAEHQLPPVTENAPLQAAARTFADFMAQTTKYGHQADGREVADRTAEQGYEHCLVLENLAYRFRPGGFATEELASGFVEGWKESRSHRQTLLDPDVCDTGVAVVRSPANGYYYAVQIFGRPKTLQIAFQVHNQSSAAVQYTVSCFDSAGSFTVPARAIATHVRCRNTKVEFPASRQAAVLEPISGGHYLIRIAPSGRIALQKREGPVSGTDHPEAAVPQ